MDRFLRRLFTVITVVGFGYVSAQESTMCGEMPQRELEKIETVFKFDETAPPTGEVRPLAEWEPMEAVMIRYPFGIPMSLIKTFAEEIKVYVIVASETQKNTVISLFNENSINIDNVSWFVSHTDSYWTRDYGPWFIEYQDNEPKLGIVNFRYNRPRPYDDKIPIVVADSLNMNYFSMNLVQTGGNYMADGIGIGASTDLVIEENNISLDDINKKMKDYLGVSTYHLNDDPLGDYIKHIDCWGKFLSPNKIIIAKVPQGHPQYSKYEAVANYYATAKSGWGTRYKVYRVNVSGNHVVTPYTNCLILNNRIFIPISGSSMDEPALEVYREAMPGYEVIGVLYNEWLNTDALHCRTHEINDREMLRIKHMPTLGVTGRLEMFPVIADIYPFSGSPLYSDSVRVYYKYTKNSPYESIVMDNLSSSSCFKAKIPVSITYDSIYYYVHAADQSGRSENHPYMGAQEPHSLFYGVCSGPLPDLRTSAEVLDLKLEPEQRIDTSISIFNVGAVNLVYSYSVAMENNEEWVSIGYPGGVVFSGDSSLISLSFDAKGLEEGRYKAKLIIEHNSSLGLEIEEKVIDLMMEVTKSLEVTELPEGEAMSVSPNPFSDQLRVRFVLDKTQNINLSLFNILGEEMYTYNQQFNQGEYQINAHEIWPLQELNHGIYFFTMQAGKQKIQQKVIKW